MVVSTLHFLTGFEWYLGTKTVWMGPKKLAKYVEKLTGWVAGERVRKKMTQNIVGTLEHCALVIPLRRSHLVSFYRLLGSQTFVLSCRSISI